jgi:hypothetical protein
MPGEYAFFRQGLAMNYIYLSLSARCNSVVEIDPTQLGIREVRRVGERKSL